MLPEKEKPEEITVTHGPSSDSQLVVLNPAVHEITPTGENAPDGWERVRVRLRPGTSGKCPSGTLFRQVPPRPKT